MLTEEQKTLARSALGLPNERNQSYRNRYRAPKIGDVPIAWHQMRDNGYAVCTPVGKYVLDLAEARGVSNAPA